jgi:fructosamine-3-kinase
MKKRDLLSPFLPPYRDFPRHRVEESMPSVTKRLRANAPFYLDSLLCTGVFKDLVTGQLKEEDITALDGGSAGAVFFIKTGGVPVIVKFRHDGVLAEAEALRAWQAIRVKVPSVLVSGIVTLIKKDSEPTGYLILEGIMDEQGNPAVSVEKYLLKHPEKAGEIGQHMGRELATIHQMTPNYQFGGYSDKTITCKELFHIRLKENRECLYTLGYTDKNIDQISKHIDDVSFPQTGICVHGDFVMKNVLVESSEVPKIRIIDPNPRIDDPYLDIALLINNLTARKLLYESNPNEATLKSSFVFTRTCYTSLLGAYRTYNGQDFDRKRLRINLMIDALTVARHTERKLSQVGMSNMKKRLDLKNKLNISKKIAQNHARELLTKE